MITSPHVAFCEGEDLQVGIEDEVMLLDPETLELAPRAPALIGKLAGDERFKLELPASQLEILTQPAARVGDAVAQLLAARLEANRAAAGLARLAGAGVHPFSPGRGELNQLERYQATILEYGAVAERQLVCATQIHVSLTGPDRVLAVYNAARSFLPLLAALAANSPFYEGRDSGLASVRVKLCDLLPRQGVPPALHTWTQYADALAWGQASGRYDAGRWWWELRLHPRLGTLEFRVPDAQTTVGEVAGLAATAQSLVAWLSARHAAGDLPAQAAETWRIEENRWSACRHGVEGTMADLEAGELALTAHRLSVLLDALEPFAAQLGCRSELGAAREMIRENGAIRQRRLGAEEGPGMVARYLADRFLEPWSG